jgi:GT2 family glycosyltransferase
MSDRDTSAHVAVIVLTFNQREKTLECLSHVLGQEYSHYRVVLWDNGSEDGTLEAVTATYPEVLVHRSETNLGVASGRNAGARLAIEALSPKYLLFLDNDIVITPGFIASLIQPLEEDATIGQTQAKLRFADDRERLNDGGGCRIRFWRGQTLPVGFGEIDRGQHDERKPCVACGGAMATRTELFQALGGFDAKFDPVGPEDLDYSLRLQKAGYTALYVPQALGYHEVSHTFGGGEYTEMYAKHKARNWFRFLLRHAPMHQKVAFLTISAPFLVLRLIVREGKAGNLGAVRGAVRGLLEFWREGRGAKRQPDDRDSPAGQGG